MMKLYIKEWAEGTATLISESGQVLWTFCCVEDAITSCSEWIVTHLDEDEDVHLAHVDYYHHVA